jgi:hypothetical protein
MSDNKTLIITLLSLLVAGLVIALVIVLVKRSHKENKPDPPASFYNWSDQNKKDFVNSVVANFVKVPCVQDPNFAKMYNDAIVMMTQEDLIPYLERKMSYDQLVQNILLNKGDPNWLPNMLTACYKNYCSNFDNCTNKLWVAYFPTGVKQLLRLSFTCLNNNKCDNFDKNFNSYVLDNKIYPWMVFDPQQDDKIFTDMMKAIC